MRSLMLSVPGTLSSDMMLKQFRESCGFRVDRVLPERPEDTVEMALAMKADILLMEVSRCPGYGFEERLSAAKRVKDAFPPCRVALLCDERTMPDAAQQVKSAKQNGLVDAFFYTSVSADYLKDALEAL